MTAKLECLWPRTRLLVAWQPRVVVINCGHPFLALGRGSRQVEVQCSSQMDGEGFEDRKHCDRKGLPQLPCRKLERDGCPQR